MILQKNKTSTGALLLNIRAFFKSSGQTTSNLNILPAISKFYLLAKKNNTLLNISEEEEEKFDSTDKHVS